MGITTKEISLLVEGQLVGDPNLVITGPSKIEEGGKELLVS